MHVYVFQNLILLLNVNLNSNQQREIQINVNKEDKTTFRRIDWLIDWLIGILRRIGNISAM